MAACTGGCWKPITTGSPPWSTVFSASRRKLPETALEAAMTVFAVRGGVESPVQ